MLTRCSNRTIYTIDIYVYTFNTFMILIKSGLHAYISAIKIFQLP